MPHEEYIREVHSSRTVLLCIHGIIGTPDHFTELISCIPSDWSVFNILLDGHGKRPEDFSRTSMKKWEAQVGALATKLAERYNSIVIAAHSMGTLFAIDAALAHPGKVKLLFLMNVPLRILPRPEALRNALGVVFSVPSSNPMIKASKAAYGIEPDPRLWKYVPWISRYAELFRKIIQTEKKLSSISVPCYAFMSGRDELVSVSSIPLLASHQNIHTFLLKRSGHYYYTPKEKSNLQRVFIYLCRKYAEKPQPEENLKIF